MRTCQLVSETLGRWRGVTTAGVREDAEYRRLWAPTEQVGGPEGAGYGEPRASFRERRQSKADSHTPSFLGKRSQPSGPTIHCNLSPVLVPSASLRR